MLNLNSILIGSPQPQVLVNFYQKVFEKPADMAMDVYSGWMVGNAFFTIGPHSDISGISKEPGRVLFNFETPQVKEEFDRLKNLGAAVIKEPYDMEGMWIATLADPDGNYFQLMSPWQNLPQK